MVAGTFQKTQNLYSALKMVLDLKQIKNALETQKKSGTINRAKIHQDRIRFHAETKLSSQASYAGTNFLNWVGSLIPSDKSKIFRALFQYPVKTAELTGIIFDKLSRVFDGRNPAFNYQFTSPEDRDDWEYYRQDVLKEPAIWQTDGWENFKTEINSVLVVDLPEEQSGVRPEPYFYWLPIAQVIDYRVNKNTQNMDYIIFKQGFNENGHEQIAVIDDLSYRLFTIEYGDILEEVTNSLHGLAYCPARFFWNDPLALGEPDIKVHPLSKVLESLDWFLFFHTSKRHLDLYGAYPIYSGYESDCDYSNALTGEECDGGHLRDKQGNFMFGADSKLLACPKCGDKRIAGVGSFVTVPVPLEGEVDLRNPVQMLIVDKSSLDYNVQEVMRLREEIINSVVGVDGGVVNEQAINEKQVNANFENQSTILNRIKKGFEEAQDFVDETACRLRYGNTFISADINLGTEFYAVDPMELRKRYALAKSNGASTAELDAMQGQILETEYRHNPQQLQRMLTLSQIEPFTHFSREEVFKLQEKQIISQIDFVIKINFTTFVYRFERENGNIIEFGLKRPFHERITIINEKFKEYARQQLSDIGPGFGEPKQQEQDDGVPSTRG
jgi:hypothetical protein